LSVILLILHAGALLLFILPFSSPGIRGGNLIYLSFLTLSGALSFYDFFLLLAESFSPHYFRHDIEAHSCGMLSPSSSKTFDSLAALYKKLAYLLLTPLALWSPVFSFSIGVRTREFSFPFFQESLQMGVYRGFLPFKPPFSVKGLVRARRCLMVFSLFGSTVPRRGQLPFSRHCCDSAVRPSPPLLSRSLHDCMSWAKSGPIDKDRVGL